MRPILLILFLGWAGIPFLATAATKSASYSAEVEPGRWAAIRLRNLPEGVRLDVDVTVDGPVAVLLINEAASREFPAVKRPLFRGETADRLGFFARIPASGHYFLVVDNREGTAARAFTVDVAATVATAEQRPSEEQTDAAVDDDGAGETPEVLPQFARFTEGIAKLFVFDRIDIKAARCGKANLYAEASSIVVCAEYAERLLADLGDRDRASSALAFAVFHELGHVLLRQWRYPFYANEEVADEFATALMVMLDAAGKARTQAEYFSVLSESEATRRDDDVDDRHPMSRQRARNILNWLDDRLLVRRWQPVLVPRMQTRLLTALRDRPTGWTDTELVEQELARRASQ